MAASLPLPSHTLAGPPVGDFAAVHWGVTSTLGVSAVRAVQAGLERGAPLARPVKG